ncbi:3-phosphoshikimate 1-carboxyvinyltransferase [Nostoc linckia z16]|nr:3-phosphoshikimate 1-carboxyvinyltransferase [Nostoc linckia z16]
MNLFLEAGWINGGIRLSITGSKSETNRLLLLQALYPSLTIENASVSDDSEVMQAALANADAVVDVHHAGTAMRFLTAFFAQQPGREVLLTGSPRMQERPIALLVEALRRLGADIQYTGKEGFPPLHVKGKHLEGGKVSMSANVSSQYITALLLVAPKMKNGLELVLEGKITSQPYIEMTLGLLKKAGIAASFEDKTITVPFVPDLVSRHFIVESDWSSASYYYSIIALSPIGTSLAISSFRKYSLQGDAALQEIYKAFGVTTTFTEEALLLEKTIEHHAGAILLDLNKTPDIAQTIAVTCLGLGIGCALTGLHTLTIKETDRLAALKMEMKKFDAVVEITQDTLMLEPSSGKPGATAPVIVATYNDHRMAMAFAPLALLRPLIIEDAEVVSKSYPQFWEDLKKLGFQITVP